MENIFDLRKRKTLISALLYALVAAIFVYATYQNFTHKSLAVQKAKMQAQMASQAAEEVQNLADSALSKSQEAQSKIQEALDPIHTAQVNANSSQDTVLEVNSVSQKANETASKAQEIASSTPKAKSRADAINNANLATESAVSSSNQAQIAIDSSAKAKDYADSAVNAISNANTVANITNQKVSSLIEAADLAKEASIEAEENYQKAKRSIFAFLSQSAADLTSQAATEANEQLQLATEIYDKADVTYELALSMVSSANALANNAQDAIYSSDAAIESAKKYEEDSENYYQATSEAQQKAKAEAEEQAKAAQAAKVYSSGGVLTKSKGVNYFNGKKETWYSQKVLPGGGLNIPGRHVNDAGLVCDGDGYICVASVDYPKGTVVQTSLGIAKVYDCGCAPGVIDIYTNW